MQRQQQADAVSARSPREQQQCAVDSHSVCVFYRRCCVYVCWRGVTAVNAEAAAGGRCVCALPSRAAAVRSRLSQRVCVVQTMMRVCVLERSDSGQCRGSSRRTLCLRAPLASSSSAQSTLTACVSFTDDVACMCAGEE